MFTGISWYLTGIIICNKINVIRCPVSVIGDMHIVAATDTG